jgi:hypothetical protein
MNKLTLRSLLLALLLCGCYMPDSPYEDGDGSWVYPKQGSLYEYSGLHYTGGLPDSVSSPFTLLFTTDANEDADRGRVAIATERSAERRYAYEKNGDFSIGFKNDGVWEFLQLPITSKEMLTTPTIIKQVAGGYESDADTMIYLGKADYVLGRDTLIAHRTLWSHTHYGIIADTFSCWRREDQEVWVVKELGTYVRRVVKTWYLFEQKYVGGPLVSEVDSLRSYTLR